MAISNNGAVQDRPEVEIKEEETPSSGGTGGAGGWIVTVYNDEDHSYKQVIDILMKATGCGLEEAQIETSEVDMLGKSVVHLAGEEECKKVAEIIGSIGLQVEATPDPLA